MVLAEFTYNFGLFWTLILIVLILWRILLFICKNYIQVTDIWYGGPHSWAVVTGATDGIGLEYARQLAEKGYNLLLLSRNQQKLNRVSDEIKSQHKSCEVRVLAVDFRRTDIYDQIEEVLKELEEIHVLVNNVGMTLPNETPEYFTNIPNLHEFISDIINVNIIAGTRLTALVLPTMEARGMGIIINVTSGVAINPVPLFSLYSSTKVCMDYMSRALSEEYHSKGIIIQSQIPFMVDTNMASYIRSLKMSPEVFVKSALKTVGKEDRCAGHFYFSVTSAICEFLRIISFLVGIDLFTKLLYRRVRSLRPALAQPSNEKIE